MNVFGPAHHIDARLLSGVSKAEQERLKEREIERNREKGGGGRKTETETNRKWSERGRNFALPGKVMSATSVKYVQVFVCV